MHRVLTTTEVVAVEQRAVATIGTSLYGLMVEAGRALAQVVEERVPEGDVVVLCGPGNNGGDGWVAALELSSAGRAVRVLTVRDPSELTGPAADAARSAVDAAVPWLVLSSDISAEDLAEAAVIIDALLGTGSRLPLNEPISGWCTATNESPAYVVSADMPTGVDGDSGAVAAQAIQADCTVTFIAPKRGLVQHPGAAHCGEVVVADLGIPDSVRDVVGAPEVWTRGEYAQLLPQPASDAHKNHRGRLLVIAGSGRYPGAAVLAVKGAQRAGAGYVTLATPEPVVSVAQSHLLASPVVGLPSSRNKTLSTSAFGAALDLAYDYDAVLIGPGITLSDGAVATVRGLVSSLPVPLVLDADALNGLIDAQELIAARNAPTVLTPHPGELSRLLGVSSGEVQSDRVSSANRLASASCTVVLKGAGTVISGAGRSVINTSGSWALATAGTGDVLAGIVAALLAQGLSPLQAGALGAHLHGRAGDIAAEEMTPFCVNAEDVPRYLPAAFGELLEVW